MTTRGDEARKIFERSVGFLRDVSGRLESGVRRTYEAAALRAELAGLRRSRDEALRDLGRLVVDAAHSDQEPPAGSVEDAIGRVDHLDETIAEKEVRVATLEQDAEPDDSTGGAEPASPPPPPRRAASGGAGDPSGSTGSTSSTRTTSSTRSTRSTRKTGTAAGSGKRRSSRKKTASKKTTKKSSSKKRTTRKRAAKKATGKKATGKRRSGR